MAFHCTSAGTRASRGRSDEIAACDYDAYLPDRLAGWDLTIPADVAADIADAEAAVRALNDAARPT